MESQVPNKIPTTQREFFTELRGQLVSQCGVFVNGAALAFIGVAIVFVGFRKLKKSILETWKTMQTLERRTRNGCKRGSA
jgi:hypothetical protein